MGYEIRNNIDKGYFNLIKATRSNESFEYLLDKFKIDLDDYWVIKKTDKFRFLEKQEYKKYCGITCFRKDLFKKEDIELCLSVIYSRLDLMIKFLTKPFPPIEMLNKIKVIK